mmetsp:Transcript_114469/g.262599  ORF Transcript_114469/g.262599 Transcript_114469/m.262599 type:complete len:216 (+) Transcript_114469:230-877(+)
MQWPALLPRALEQPRVDAGLRIRRHPQLPKTPETMRISAGQRCRRHRNQIPAIIGRSARTRYPTRVGHPVELTNCDGAVPSNILNEGIRSGLAQESYIFARQQNCVIDSKHRTHDPGRVGPSVVVSACFTCSVANKNLRGHPKTMGHVEKLWIQGRFSIHCTFTVVGEVTEVHIPIGIQPQISQRPRHVGGEACPTVFNRHPPKHLACIGQITYC